MREAPSTVDFRKLASLLRNCTTLNSLRELHEQISKSGHDHYTFLGNHLIQMYGKCSSPQQALITFQTIRHRNIFSWNIMLTAFAQNGHLQEARNLFNRMPKQDIFSWNSMVAANAQNGELDHAMRLFETMPRTDSISWNTLLAAYAENGDLLYAKSIFENMPDRSTVSWNSMITAYMRSGKTGCARRLFNQMPQFNLLSWNAMLAGYTQNGESHKAIQLFAMLDMEGIDVDIFTYVSVLDACGAVPNLLLGKEVHHEMQLVESNVYTETALVSMYGRCGSVELAEAVFEHMSYRNVVSWNAMLSAYTENGLLEKAEDVFQRLPERDSASGNALISGYVQMEDLDSARRVFNGLHEREIVSWNTVIAGYARTEEGYRMLKEMDLDGVRPNNVTIVSLLSVCDGHLTQKLHCVVLDVGLETDTWVGTALVVMYGRLGDLTKAQESFTEIAVKNNVAWNSLVAAYARNGRTHEALYLFREMGLDGVQPDPMLFNSILFACSHRGMLRNGIQKFIVMQGDFDIEPKYAHFLCVIDLLGRAGELRAAEEVLENMPFEADSFAWTVLLSACKSQRDVQRGAVAGIKALQVDSHQPSTYVMLSCLGL